MDIIQNELEILLVSYRVDIIFQDNMYHVTISDKTKQFTYSSKLLENAVSRAYHGA